MDWLEIKGLAGGLTLSKDALHIYAALVIQLAACFIMRKSLGSILPWCTVLALELINEGLDLLFELEPSIQQWQIKGGMHDIVNTMALPTILLILVRQAPSLFTKAPPTNGLGDPPTFS